jgi:hypothetical protein
MLITSSSILRSSQIQFFRDTHKNIVYMCVFIKVSVRTYINIYVCNVFLKKDLQRNKCLSLIYSLWFLIVDEFKLTRGNIFLFLNTDKLQPHLRRDGFNSTIQSVSLILPLYHTLLNLSQTNSHLALVQMFKTREVMYFMNDTLISSKI